MSNNPILDELIYDQPSGALLFKGVRYLLIRPETIAGLQKALVESCGQQVGADLYAGGHAGGRLSAQKYKALHDFSDQEIVEFMIDMGSKIGWGNFRLASYDAAARQLWVVVNNSPFAQAYGRSDQGVCHLIRGVLAGMAEVLFGEKCSGAEVQCRAMGDEYCRFVIEGQGESSKLKAESS